MPGADEVVSGAVDLRAGRGCGADEQWGRARLATSSAVAQGLRRVRQRSRQSLCRAAAGGSRLLPTARPAAAGLAGGGRCSGAPGHRSAISASDWPNKLNGYEAFTPETLRYSPDLPELHALTAEWAWEGSTGRGVKVAVIDSGINADHPAVGGMVRGYVRVVDEQGRYRYDAAPHADQFGHGTACAGLIHKVAPEAELYSVQVLNPAGGGGLSSNGTENYGRFLSGDAGFGHGGREPGGLEEPVLALVREIPSRPLQRVRSGWPQMRTVSSRSVAEEGGHGGEVHLRDQPTAVSWRKRCGWTWSTPARRPNSASRLRIPRSV